ncbi:exosome complex component RRP41 [Helicoverpa armigera]|uniref:exosome complex component RRP41 n=1 Tax=Helicoverpa armigera TaxID=29058 RepID=UPI003083C3CE
MALSLVHTELVSMQGLRVDGRRPHELAVVRCKLGASSTPDGSVYLEQGCTKVLVAVYGPHQASKTKMLPNAVALNCKISIARFATAMRKSDPADERKVLENMSMNLKQALLATLKSELYPRSQIDVYVEVLQDDGNAFCASVNAACLALIDAGIPMREYVTACSASIAITDDQKQHLLVDVNKGEEAAGCAVLTVACLPDTGKIAVLDLTHRVHMDHFEKVLNTAIQGCKDIKVVLDKALRQYLAETWPH